MSQTCFSDNLNTRETHGGKLKFPFGQQATEHSFEPEDARNTWRLFLGSFETDQLAPCASHFDSDRLQKIELE